MKRIFLFLVACLLAPVYVGALTFVPGELLQSTNASLLHILPRPDKQEDPTAVLFIKTDILNVSVRGNVIGVPRRVREGYVLFVPQGTKQLQVNAPLYATQTIHFKPVQGGQHYEMALTTKQNSAQVEEARRLAKELDLTRTEVKISLYFDYMDVPKELYRKEQALIYLDKTLDFAQWQQLLMPNAAYRPFDVSGNEKNPCCILVNAEEPIENVFKMRVAELDSNIENLEGGSTYHTTLTLTPKN